MDLIATCRPAHVLFGDRGVCHARAGRSLRKFGASASIASIHSYALLWVGGCRSSSQRLIKSHPNARLALAAAAGPPIRVARVILDERPIRHHSRS